jgi:hypothetical protein
MDLWVWWSPRWGHMDRALKFGAYRWHGLPAKVPRRRRQRKTDVLPMGFDLLVVTPLGELQHETVKNQHF